MQHLRKCRYVVNRFMAMCGIGFAEKGGAACVMPRTTLLSTVSYPLKAILFLGLFVQPIFIYMANYDIRDCDDRASHYYASAFLFADPALREDIANAMPAWRAKDPGRWSGTWVRLRLTSAKNYIAADAIIAQMKHLLQGRVEDDRDNGYAYALPVKAAFLSMLVLAMAYLAATSRGTPLGMWPTLMVMCLVAYSTLNWPLVAPIPRYNHHPFTSYVPRGSASLFIPALLMCYACRRRALFGLTCLLLLLWHQALAQVLLLSLGGAIIVIEMMVSQGPFRDRVAGCLRGSRIYIVSIAVVLVGGLLVGLRLDRAFLPDPAGVAGPWPGSLDALWTNGASILIVAASAWLLVKSRIVDPESKRDMRFMLGTALLLMACDAWCIVTQSPPFASLACRLMDPRLLAEVPLRVSGPRYLCLVVLVVFALVRIWRKAKLTGAWPSAWVGLVIAICVANTLVVRQKLYNSVTKGQSNYSCTDCQEVKFNRVRKETLADLNPRDLPEFMFSLADYLAEDPEEDVRQLMRVGDTERSLEAEASGRNDLSDASRKDETRLVSAELARSIAVGVSKRAIYVDGYCGVIPSGVDLFFREHSSKVSSYRQGFTQNREHLFNSGLLVMQYGIGRPEPTEREYDIIRRYVTNGGRVLLLCPAWVWSSYDKKPLEQLPYLRIAREFGLELESGYVKAPMKIVTGAFSVDGADDILQGTFSVVGYRAQAQVIPIVVGNDGKAAAVAARKGAARIIVWGQNNLLSVQGAPSSARREFLRKAMEWLLAEAERGEGADTNTKQRITDLR